MTTNIFTKSSTVDLLVGAYRSHVLGRALPEPTSVTLVAHAQRIEVQPSGAMDLCSRLGNLLVWAYTLADVTATWWHTSDGALHISIHGRAASGVRFLVYGGGAFIECLGLVPLARDQQDGVSLDELYALVCLLREAAHHEREAA